MNNDSVNGRHQTRVELFGGPHRYQAYRARCSCGWKGMPKWKEAECWKEAGEHTADKLIEKFKYDIIKTMLKREINQ